MEFTACSDCSQEVAVHDLSVQLALALGGDLKTKEESQDTDEGPVADASDGESHPAVDPKQPKKSKLTRRVHCKH